MRAFFLSALAALSATYAVAIAAPARDHDEARLRHIKLEAWPAFYRTQDAKGLAGFLDSVFVNVGPDGSLTTRAEELDAVRAQPWNPKNFRYTIQHFVWMNDDLVLVVGRGESERTGEDGKPCRHGYASSNLLKRAADTPLGWRALMSHVSGVACTPM
ncbi:MAG: nuclear transport factor 2 family protein [Alphaproteobacteria bacterium]|nr:nuclear transport factor 2 family protein [Alphaproteobacteria bacterium]